MGEHLTIRSWEVTKSELFTTSKHQFSSWIEKKLHSTSQSQTRTNKQGKKKKAWRNTVTVWWSAVSLSHTAAVWMPVKSSLLGTVFHISMRYTENYGMTASIGQQAGPDCSPWQYHPISQKLNERGSKVCLVCHIHLTSAASSIPSALFREKVFKISKMQILKKMIS